MDLVRWRIHRLYEEWFRNYKISDEVEKDYSDFIVWIAYVLLDSKLIEFVFYEDNEGVVC